MAPGALRETLSQHPRCPPGTPQTHPMVLPQSHHSVLPTASMCAWNWGRQNSQRRVPWSVCWQAVARQRWVTATRAPHDSHPPSLPIPAGSGAGSTLRGPHPPAEWPVRLRGHPDALGGAAIPGVGVWVGRPGSSWIMASSVASGPSKGPPADGVSETAISPGSRVGAARPLVRGTCLTLTHLFGLTHPRPGS